MLATSLGDENIVCVCVCLYDCSLCESDFYYTTTLSINESYLLTYIIDAVANNLIIIIIDLD